MAEETVVRKKLFKGIEEVIDKNAQHWAFEKHDWAINNPASRMLYVPKGSVAYFMKLVDKESDKRINKYRDYATSMKVKFEEYEQQSEVYYAEMLDKFKSQARDAVMKKQAEIDQINREIVDSTDKVDRIQARIVQKSYKGVMSDDEDDSQTPDDVIVCNMQEYNRLKQAYLTEKAVMLQWVQQFKQDKGRYPGQQDVGDRKMPSEAAYIKYRVNMIKTDKLPIEFEDFETVQIQPVMDMTKGFNQQEMLQQHAKQQQAELDNLRKQFVMMDSTGQLQTYVNFVKQKDNLMMQHALGMDELVRTNGLLAQDKLKVQQSLEQLQTQNMMAKADSQPVSEIGAKILQLQIKNADLLQQIEALNKLNSVMLQRVKESGGKGLGPKQIQEIENDLQECKKNMVETNKEAITSLKLAGQQMQSQVQDIQSAPAQSTDEERQTKVQEMERVIQEFKQDLDSKDQKVIGLQQQGQQMQSDFDAKLMKIESDFNSLQQEQQQEFQQMQQSLKQLDTQQPVVNDNQVVDQDIVKEIESVTLQFKQQLQDKQMQLQALELVPQDNFQEVQVQVISELRDKVAETLKQNKQFQIQIEKFAEAAGETKTLKEKASVLKQHLKEATVELDIVSGKYKEEQVKRKKLLNELEDMKGKVRVYCRIRPFSNSEKTNADKAQPCVNITDETSLVVGTQKNRMKAYNFDAVFGLNSTQEEVFEDTRRLIQSAIDGYNVCIFAYGQTGSGKTFTIQGSPEMPGLTPRSIVEMFEILKTMTNFDVKLKCYMVELYLNALRDLLKPKDQQAVELDIKEKENGMVEIQGVTEVELTSIGQTETIFEDGLSGRKTRKTNMNDESSRSHLVFSIIIDSTNVNTGVRTVGKISFVDLAGSEKSSKTGTDAVGQEEANAINLSLSALGNVISALSDGSKFVPYRNHILTKLMKDSLGGTAKTLMFVNCSPSVYNESETKNSLDYATRVKKIKNTVGKNVESKESGAYTKILNQMDSMMEKLKAMLRDSDRKQDYELWEMEINKSTQKEEN